MQGIYLSIPKRVICDSGEALPAPLFILEKRPDVSNSFGLEKEAFAKKCILCFLYASSCPSLPLFFEDASSLLQ